MQISKTVARKAAAKLRKAERLMNSGGEHWTRGFFVKKIYHCDTPEPGYDPRECQFCAIGGLRQVIFGDTFLDHEKAADPVYRAALTALASTVNRRKTIDIYDHDANRWRRIPLDPTAVTFKAEPTSFTDPLEGRVIEWNDDQRRQWEDVSAGFQQAAAKLDALASGDVEAKAA